MSDTEQKNMAKIDVDGFESEDMQEFEVFILFDWELEESLIEFMNYFDIQLFQLYEGMAMIHAKLTRDQIHSLAEIDKISMIVSADSQVELEQNADTEVQQSDSDTGD